MIHDIIKDQQNEIVSLRQMVIKLHETLYHRSCATCEHCKLIAPQEAECRLRDISVDLNSFCQDFKHI